MKQIENKHSKILTSAFEKIQTNFINKFGSSIEKKNNSEIANCLLELIEPYALPNDSIEDFKVILNDGIFAWNLTIIPQELRDEIISNFMENSNLNLTLLEREVLFSMMKRKADLFPENELFIIDSQIELINDKVNLSIFTFSPNEIKEKE